MRAAFVRLVAALVVMTATAAADTTARIDANGTCDLAMLDAQTNELLGHTGIRADGSARFVIETTEVDSTVAADLGFFDELGVAQPPRTLTAATCDELVESLAVVMALVLRQSAEEPTPPATPTLPTPRSDDATFVPVRAPSSGRVLELGAAMHSSRDVAIVLGGELDGARLGVGADVEVAMPRTVALDVGSGAVRLFQARIDAAACVRVQGLAACGVVAGGLVEGSGEDLMVDSSAFRPIAALGARLEWRQLVSRRVGVRLFAGIEQLLVRPSFLVDQTPVWTYPAQQASLGASVFFRVP